ncbi:Lrp/AsnC family transcriptional regulator [Asanoa sp. NPDC049573]|uniref:Lrp/AsnC family transcriptional regulator n=1 Tax=Asanoa sp. NPDC049573 TaxID=3155396 RepID=UPI0034361BC4
MVAAVLLDSGVTEDARKKRSPLAAIADVVSTPVAPATLDAVDLRLLELLVQDARTSQRGLARELQMSPPAVGDRIARLERLGVIRGYRADIDWAALGFPMQVFLSVIAATDQAAIIRALHAIPEVEEVSVVTGSIDLLARLRVRDQAHLRAILLEGIWQIPGVSRTETLLSLAETPRKEFVHGLIAELRDNP